MVFREQFLDQSPLLMTKIGFSLFQMKPWSISPKYLPGDQKKAPCVIWFRIVGVIRRYGCSANQWLNGNCFRSSVSRMDGKMFTVIFTHQQFWILQQWLLRESSKFITKSLENGKISFAHDSNYYFSKSFETINSSLNLLILIEILDFWTIVILYATSPQRHYKQQGRKRLNFSPESVIEFQECSKF